MDETNNGLYVPPMDETEEEQQELYAQKNVRRTRETRASQSREANSRAAEIDFSHFDKIFEMNSKGKTYMPPEATPPGYIGMWVRESVYGNSDYSNVNRRIQFGWIPPESSNYPKLGFVDIYGDRNEDTGLVRRGGLVWMLRLEALHKREMAYIEKKLKSSKHFSDSSKRIGVEGGFVTGRGSDGQAVTFGSDAKSKHIAALFNH